MQFIYKREQPEPFGGIISIDTAQLHFILRPFKLPLFTNLEIKILKSFLDFV